MLKIHQLLHIMYLYFYFSFIHFDVLNIQTIGLHFVKEIGTTIIKPLTTATLNLKKNFAVSC